MPAGHQNVQPRFITDTTSTSASVSDLCVLTDPGHGIRVTNISGSSPLWFTVSQIGGPCPPPVINGLTTLCVASVAGAQVAITHQGRAGSVVQLTSAAPTTYTVEVVASTVNA